MRHVRGAVSEKVYCKMARRIILLLCAALSGSLAGCAGQETAMQEGTGIYFDTVVSFQIAGDESGELLEGCLDLCGEMERIFSRTNAERELYAVNHREGNTVELSEDLAAVVELGIRFYSLTDGKLDITVAPLCQLWDFSGGREEPPSQEEIDAALEKVDGSSIRLEGRTLYFDREDTELDLGALAKGYISDKLKEYLEENGAEHALINLGGNVMTLGTQPDGDPWRVGIQEPFAERGTLSRVVQVEDQAVISAGTYERYFQWEGKLYHHILDPDTGYPADTGLSQVTILCDRGILGDALSTSVLLLGEERGARLLEMFPEASRIV